VFTTKKAISAAAAVIAAAAARRQRPGSWRPPSGRSEPGWLVPALVTLVPALGSGPFGMLGNLLQVVVSSARRKFIQYYGSLARATD
jgi:hypothetical protein